MLEKEDLITDSRILYCRVVDRLEKEGLITERISEGETKFMGVCKLKQYDHYR